MTSNNDDTARNDGQRLIAAVDFETFYDSKDGYSLTNLTPYEYVRDSRFNAYLVAVAFSDGRPTFVGHPKSFDWSQLDDALLLAHNAAFDGMVLMRLEELSIVPTPPKPREWLDTADMVAFLGVTRNLKNACKELLDMEVSKAVRTAMDGKTDLDLNEQEMKDLLEYGGSDADECLKLFMTYGDKWPQIERDISTQTRNAAWRGINVNVKAVEEGIDILSKERDKASAQLPWVARGEKPGSLPALADEVKKLGLPVPPSFRKNDPRFLAWQDQYKDECPFLQARITYAGTTPHIARLQNLHDHLCNGFYHSDVRYFGTHTGRTASGSNGGRETETASKLNLLNLPKAPIHGVDMRGMFIPRPGHKFIIYDYGQIEARVAKWLAGDTSFVQMLNDEGNIYQAEAVKMGWVEPKAPPLKKTNKSLYQLAKAACLGLQFRMSASKFILSCHSMGLFLDPKPREQWPGLDRRLRFIFANTFGTCDIETLDVRDVGEFFTADQVVNDWRKANAKIVQFWSALETSLRSAADAKKPVHYFRLPSGRLKPYFRPSIKPEMSTIIDPDTGEKKTSVRHTLTAAVIKDRPASFFHGGSLTENIVQATARDIMAQAAVDIEKMYPQCKYMWSCYDEIIFEVHEDDCEEMNKVIPEVMCHGPSISEWIDDNLPLEVEGGIFDRYCK